jgi:hydroxyacylglutathione hydrolase
MEIKQLVVGPLATNCYLVLVDDDLVVIDPGEDANKILEQVGKINKKIKYIILTHYHFDHVMAALEIRKKTKAKVCIHQKDQKLIEFKANRMLKDGEIIKIGQETLKVIHSPGHTEGSICLLAKNEIFVGDLIFAEGYGRTDLAGGSEEEIKDSFKKLNKLLEKNKDLVCYPGHGEIFKLKDHFIF